MGLAGNTMLEELVAPKILDWYAEAMRDEWPSGTLHGRTLDAREFQREPAVGSRTDRR